MSKKILIVDDEQDLREGLELRFKASGFDVVTADNGQDGLELAKKEVPDVVILDAMMPKMDGFKVSGLLKIDARFKNIPIIMLTARDDEEDEGIRQEAGIDAYVNKLIDYEDLLAKVNELTA